MHYANTLFVVNDEIYFYGKPWNTWLTFFWKFSPSMRSLYTNTKQPIRGVCCLEMFQLLGGFKT